MIAMMISMTQITIGIVGKKNMSVSRMPGNPSTWNVIICKISDTEFFAHEAVNSTDDGNVTDTAPEDICIDTAMKDMNSM